MRKKEITKEEFLEKYIEYANLSTDAMKHNNYRKNNILVDKIYKLVNKCESSIFFEDALNELMDNDDIEIKISAAYRSLKYNFNVERAKKILIDASKRDDIGISALHAKMNLKIYNKEI